MKIRIPMEESLIRRIDSFGAKTGMDRNEAVLALVAEALTAAGIPVVDKLRQSDKLRRMTIQEHREHLGLTRADLAKTLSVHPRTVARWETEPLMPQRDTRKRIAAAFDVDPVTIAWHVPDWAVAG